MEKRNNRSLACIYPERVLNEDILKFGHSSILTSYHLIIPPVPKLLKTLPGISRHSSHSFREVAPPYYTLIFY